MYNENFVPQPLQTYTRLQDITANKHFCDGIENIFAYTLPWRLSGGGTIKQIYVHPMLLKRTATGDPITTFELYQLEGDILEKDLVSANESIESLDPPTDSIEAVIIPVGWFTVNNTFRAQQYYYFKISDGTTTWYSEAVKFEFADTTNGTWPEKCNGKEWMLMSWSNPDCILGEKYPTSAPSLMLFVPADLGQPDYDYIEETEEGGPGEEVILFQRLEKRWKVKFLAPEYIVDALQAAQLFSNFAINFVDGTGIVVSKLQITQQWTGDCYAEIEMTFATDFITKTACC